MNTKVTIMDDSEGNETDKQTNKRQTSLKCSLLVKLTNAMQGGILDIEKGLRPH